MIKRWLTDTWADLIHMVPHDWWMWLTLILWAIPVLVALWVLSAVKNIAGWPGVAAVLTLGAYVFGFARAALDLNINPFI